MGLLKIIDISNCRLLTEEAIIKLADTNRAIVQFKASGCKNAMTDKALKTLVECSKTEFEILDLSYCSNLTDAGLESFAEKNPMQVFLELHLSGLTEVTNNGFISLLSTCTKTCVLLNISLNDQLTITGDI